MRPVLLSLALVLAVGAAGAAPVCERRGFAIAVDPGHTRASPGATSARGVPEVEFNEHLASRLVRTLRKAGFDDVFLTRPADASVSLADRARVANERNARLFLSIHHDSAQPRFFSTWSYRGVPRPYSDEFEGYSLFVSHENGDAAGSLRFAQLLGRRLRDGCLAPSLHHAQQIPGEGRELLDPGLGIYRFDGLAVLRATRMPAVLFEAGLIVNRHEEARLRSARHQRRIVAALTGAIADFCAAATPPSERPPTGSPAAPDAESANCR